MLIAFFATPTSFMAAKPLLKRFNRNFLQAFFLVLALFGFVFSDQASAFLGPSKAGAPVQISADNTFYDQASGQSQFKGHVQVDYDNIRITGPEARVGLNGEGKPQIAYFTSRPLVTRTLPQKGKDDLRSDLLEIDMAGSAFKATGNVESNLHTIATAPIKILSDVQQFDNTRKLLSASGGVKVFYNELTITSSRAVMTLGANGQADRVVFIGNAHLVQGNSTIVCNQLTVKVGSKTLLAEGNVNTHVLVPAKNGKPASNVLMTSDYQQFDQLARTILASGRVHIDYEDYDVRGPKANIRLKPGDGMDIESILLTSRPTIIDKERRVTADQILVSVDPKRFDARGNVKTQFQTKSSSPAATETKPTGTGKAGTSAIKGNKGKGGTQKPEPAKPSAMTEEEELGL
jgi:lipopolysaccharide export system protein LptA